MSFFFKNSDPAWTEMSLPKVLPRLRSTEHTGFPCIFKDMGCDSEFALLFFHIRMHFILAYMTQNILEV